jgi:hypothetical protein
LSLLLQAILKPLVFLLAAKSIFRFGDLKNKDRKLTEYVLVELLSGIALIQGLLIQGISAQNIKKIR